MIFLEVTSHSSKIALKFTDIISIVGNEVGSSISMSNGTKYVVKEGYDTIMKQITSFKWTNV